jgi:hypothetical protein
MADPVANVEIEDVLSSIRRLVSENARNERPEGADQTQAKNTEPDPAATPNDGATAAAEPTPDPVAAAEEPPTTKPEAPAGDMLLLTPALRVADPAEEAGESDDESDEVAQHIEDAAPPADTEESHAALASTIRDAVHDAVDATLADIAPEPDQPAPEAAEDTPDKPAPEPLSFAHHRARDDEGLTSLEDRIAGLEAAVALSADDEWEPDGEGLDDDNAATPVEALSWEDSDSFDTAEDSAPTTSRVRFASEIIEEAELATPEPPEESAVEPSAQAPADSPEEIPELVEDEAIATSAMADDIFHDSNHDAADDALEFDAEDDTLATEETVLDEGALREMVAEIVRQELQGSLGERITRNVRKLVRREIHRALAARELD